MYVNEAEVQAKIIIDYLRNVHKYKLNIQFCGDGGCDAVTSGSRRWGILIPALLLSLTPPKSFYPQKGRSKLQNRICHVALEVRSEWCEALVPQLKKNIIKLKV